MMNNHYLTEERKNYYMSDFRKLLSIKDSEFWEIDGGLENILHKINLSTDIQTLYSKRFKITPGTFVIEGISYLELAFVKGAKDKLLRLLYRVKEETICDDSRISIMEYGPLDNANYKSEPKFEIGCVNNSDYFRINHINITIESLNIECHNLFWQNMKSEFEIIFNNRS